MYELRPYQLDCIEKARQVIQDPDRPCRRLILESPTGSGKTVIASHLIDRSVTLGKRVLFLAHNRELVHQASEKLEKLGVYHGIIMRGLPYNPHAPVQVASKDTLYVRGLRRVGAKALDSLPPAELLILDECFPPGTLVDGRPIEEIKPGDTVMSHLGPRRVVRVYQNPLRGDLVTIRFRSGRSLTCTPNHKIMTPGGWVQAVQLDPGDAVHTIAHEHEPGMHPVRHRLPRSSQSEEDLLQEVRRGPQVGRAAASGPDGVVPPVWQDIQLPTAEATIDMLPRVRQTPQDRDIRQISGCLQPGGGKGSQDGRWEPDEEAGGAGEGFIEAEGYGLATPHPDGERHGSDSAPSIARLNARVANGSSNQHTKKAAVSQVLQDRHRQRGSQDRHRSRWSEPWDHGEPGTRQETGQVPAIDWVESVSVQKRGSDGTARGLCPGRVVFNLEVEEAHTYYANGIHVSNCHRSVAPTWKRLVAAYPHAVCIGLTATPARADGKGLGDIWDRIIKVDTYENLIKDKYLVPTRVFAPWAPNLDGVRKNAKGDYRESDLEDRVAKRAIVGRVVDHLQEHAPGLPTIVFCVTINHSLMVLDELRDRGLICEHVDGEMDSAERDHIIHRFKNRDIQVITNCMVLTEGFDAPHCQCAVIARPTRSIVLWRQMAGRIQRPAPDKDFAMIIDMAGAVYQHGFPDDDMEWILTESERVKPANERQSADGPGTIKVCKNCGFVMRERVRFCPECGALIKPDRQLIKEKPGKVGELKRRRAVPATRAQMQDYWHKSIGIAIGKNAKIGMAAHLFRARFNIWPPKDMMHVPKNKQQWQLKASDYYATAIKCE